jgi:hypothetical protein
MDILISTRSTLQCIRWWKNKKSRRIIKAGVTKSRDRGQALAAEVISTKSTEKGRGASTRRATLRKRINRINPKRRNEERVDNMKNYN